MTRLVVTAVVVLALGAGARAWAEPPQAVALLPLDAGKDLELYGQPVASEIARALVAGGVDVVVVGPKMAVPERARLIIDGTIAAKGSAVVLAVRMRDPVDGTTLLTLSSTAPGLANIDTAAAELSTKVLPAVRERLAALRRPPEHEPPRGPVTPPVVAPAAPALAPMRVSITATSARGEPLRAALTEAVGPWAAAHQRAVTAADPAALAAERTGLAIAFDITRLTLEPGAVPLGRARVRVRISQDGAVRFDRVVVTDTVVGDRGQAAEALTARVAREVLAILRPHLRRVVAAWR